MKVLCIHGVKAGHVGITKRRKMYPCDKRHELKEGEIYTVIDTKIGQRVPLVYLIKEIPVRTWYDADWFIPLSEIDETEMERNYQTETIKTQ